MAGALCVPGLAGTEARRQAARDAGIQAPTVPIAHAMLPPWGWEGSGGCAGDAPVAWSTSASCRPNPQTCGRGDLDALTALKAVHLPLCKPAESNTSSLRHFNRSMKMDCLARLQQARSRPYRILVAGVSSALELWHAMCQDNLDSEWDKIPDRHQVSSCRPPWAAPEMRLRSFAPHQIEFMNWHIVTPINSSNEISYTPGSRCVLCQTTACWSPHGASFGGRGLEFVVENSPEPYDVIVAHTGSWDASFVKHNISGFEGGLELSVTAVIRAWRSTRIILLTQTPCGGKLRGKHKPLTPKSACAYVADINDAIRRVARRHAPAVAVLDAHQMTAALPGVKYAGSPPGIWLPQQNGWHFTEARTRAAVTAMRNSTSGDSRFATPPLAHGDMYRTFANRVFDMICPPDER